MMCKVEKEEEGRGGLKVKHSGIDTVEDAKWKSKVEYCEDTVE